MSLDTECCKRIIIIYDCNFTFNRCAQFFFVILNLIKESPYFVKLSTFNIICIQDSITELLCPFCCASVSEIHQRFATSRHTLIRPELCLIRAWSKSGYIMSLCSHDRFCDPEVFPFKPTDIIQSKCNFICRKRLFLPAPYRVIVVSYHIQILGNF